MKIAIIGGGISGMTCAWKLAANHEISLFESNDYIGGHTATYDIPTAQGTFAIDTGFIVFNDRTYPNFIALLSELGIRGQETEMSFSVFNKQSGLEYNGHTLASLFAQKKNIFKPQFWRFLKEILRFNRLAKEQLASGMSDNRTTLNDFLAENQFSDFFAHHYILPMGAAIWSSSLSIMGQFPLRLFLQFFNHHGLLDVSNRPQWYVVPGGSRHYMRQMLNKLEDKIKIHTQASIQHVSRSNKKVQIHINDEVKEFDQVIFACHSDQALSLLNDSNNLEKQILSHIPYQANEVVLHHDRNWLPTHKKAWASWNYLLEKSDVQQEQAKACVTYNMNILQGLPKDAPLFCVTLNPTVPIDEKYVYKRFIYEHPIFTPESATAQSQRHLISGKNNTWYCGAYWYNGFHEDGVHSALDVVNGVDQLTPLS